MSDSEENRTPEQIIDEFSQQAASICSGGRAREESQSKFGGEVKTKYPPQPNAVTRGRGHSVWACTGGRKS
jgi:hypothetical protein